MSATRVTQHSSSRSLEFGDRTTGIPTTGIPGTDAARGVDDIHLAREEMDRLLQLDCPHELAFEWLAHLIACNPCRRRLADQCPEDSRWILDRFLLLGDAGQVAVRVHPSAYDRVFDRIRERGICAPLGSVLTE